jgi:nicotinate-nucleotide adenylyltransferase
MSILRLGVMGGTFDPIHFGHLIAAEAAAKSYELDSVIFVPTGNSWQKEATTSAEHRLAMTKLAVSYFPDFQVSTVDVDRQGDTYTVDTLSDLKSQHPDAHFFFITGADSLAGINTWKESQKLWDLAHFVGVTRTGHKLEVPLSPVGAVTLLEIPALAISSSEIRAKVISGDSLEGLVPAKVLDYIAEHNLYRGNDD